MMNTGLIDRDSTGENLTEVQGQSKEGSDRCKSSNQQQDADR